VEYEEIKMASDRIATYLEGVRRECQMGNALHMCNGFGGLWRYN
jgi:hypothetical protein